MAIMTDTQNPITDPATVAQVVAKASETIAEAAARIPLNAEVTDDEVRKAAQIKLRSLNYPNVGPATGEGGDKTTAGVLDFQNRNGLDLTGKIDKPTLEALQTAPPKQLPAEQVNATEAEIAPKVEAVKKNALQRLMAKIATWPSIAIAVFFGIINHLGDAINALTPLKLFLHEWLDGIDKLTLITIAATVTALVSGVLWLNSRQTGDAMKVAYQGGTLGDDNKEAAAAANGAIP